MVWDRKVTRYTAPRFAPMFAGKSAANGSPAFSAFDCVDKSLLSATVETPVKFMLLIAIPLFEPEDRTWPVVSPSITGCWRLESPFILRVFATVPNSGGGSPARKSNSPPLIALEPSTDDDIAPLALVANGSAERKAGTVAANGSENESEMLPRASSDCPWGFPFAIDAVLGALSTSVPLCCTS